MPPLPPPHAPPGQTARHHQNARHRHRVSAPPPPRHRRRHPLRNRWLVRVDSHRSKPFLHAEFSRRAWRWRVLGIESCKSQWQPLRTPRWIFTLMKSDLRICSPQQNRHHRRVDPLRNHRLVRIDSHHSKPFLPEKIPIFSSVFENIKKRSRNAQATAESTSDGTDDGRMPLSGVYWSIPGVFSLIDH